MTRIIWILAIAVVLALAAWLYWPTFAGTRGARTIETPRDAPFLQPDPSDYARFLNAVVDERGFVDYTKAARVRSSLDAYIDAVGKATPHDFENDDARLAFYLNAYNALIIAGVLHYWPIESVDDAGPLRQFFRERRYLIAGKRASFHGFETRVIKRYDPRFHFALNCASASCPPLRAEPYRADRLDQQLNDQAKRFINDPAHNRYDPATRTWTLSQIFEWYADDFGGEPGIRQLLRLHAETDWPDDAKLRFEAYDWSINQAATREE